MVSMDTGPAHENGRATPTPAALQPVRLRPASAGQSRLADDRDGRKLVGIGAHHRPHRARYRRAATDHRASPHAGLAAPGAACGANQLQGHFRVRRPAGHRGGKVRRTSALPGWLDGARGLYRCRCRLECTGIALQRNWCSGMSVTAADSDMLAALVIGAAEESRAPLYIFVGGFSDK